MEFLYYVALVIGMSLVGGFTIAIIETWWEEKKRERRNRWKS